MAGEHRSRGSDYRGARIGASVACFGVVVVMLVLDAFEAIAPGYQASEIIVAMLLGTGATLLGVEVRAIRDRLS